MNGHDLTEQQQELMCLGGPLHGQLRQRGLLLQFEVTVAPNTQAPNPKFVAEPHTYVLSTFDYSPEHKVKFWRHKPLDLGRAPLLVMLEFLELRPHLKAAQAFACLRALHDYASKGNDPFLSKREVRAVIETVIRPQQPAQNKDPQP